MSASALLSASNSALLSSILGTKDSIDEEMKLIDVLDIAGVGISAGTGASGVHDSKGTQTPTNIDDEIDLLVDDVPVPPRAVRGQGRTEHACPKCGKTFSRRGHMEVSGGAVLCVPVLLYVYTASQ